MIGSPYLGVIYGALAGAATGLLSRLLMKKVLYSRDAVFYSAFAAGILARLALLAVAACVLRHEKYTIIVLFLIPMILVQMIFEGFPLKHGIKRDT